MNKRKLKGFIDLIRPFTLLAPIIVSVCIIGASFVYNGKQNISSYLLSVIIPASFSLAILNGASNILNQITDLKSDKISKPYRPIPSGIISIKQAAIVSIFLYSLSILFAFLINPVFFAIVLFIVFFTVSYSIPPRLKDKLIFNQLWVGIPRGLLGILASWSVFGNPMQTLPITIGLISMCFLIGGSITKDISDFQADKKTGTKTLINTYGIKNAAILVLPFMFFPFAFIPMLIHSNILEIYFWPLTFLAIPTIFIFYLMIKEDKKIIHLENTSSWALMYITYFFLAIGFSILTITSKILV
jgi:geranylgeranylglycerol-phosphate geranylgeranyltransferase